MNNLYRTFAIFLSLLILTCPIACAEQRYETENGTYMVTAYIMNDNGEKRILDIYDPTVNEMVNYLVHNLENEKIYTNYKINGTFCPSSKDGTDQCIDIRTTTPWERFSYELAKTGKGVGYITVATASGVIIIFTIYQFCVKYHKLKTN
jgi:hypothetical protein